MNYRSCSVFFALLLLPLAARAQSAIFPEVGKTYYLNYADKEENPALSKIQIEGLSQGTATVLRNAGNGWAEVEFVGAVWDAEKQTYAAKKIQIWLNFARVTSAREIVKK